MAIPLPSCVACNSFSSQYLIRIALKSEVGKQAERKPCDDTSAQATGARGARSGWTASGSSVVVTGNSVFQILSGPPIERNDKNWHESWVCTQNVTVRPYATAHSDEAGIGSRHGFASLGRPDGSKKGRRHPRADTTGSNAPGCGPP